MVKVTLYIAEHNTTGLKYFGKTTRWFDEQSLQENYHGSGTRWCRHLNKHGTDVTMKIFGIFDEADVEEVALQFSTENNIVDDYNWANLKVENGLDGGSKPGIPKTEEWKRKVSASQQLKFANGYKGSMHGKSLSEHQKEIASKSHSGKHVSHETRNSVSESKLGVKVSEETRKKMRKPKGPQNKVGCPHCDMMGGISLMKRYHFDNCKQLKCSNE